MDAEMSKARRWLEKRYTRAPSGRYFAHQPIYGFGSPNSEPGHLRRMARTLHMLRVVSCLRVKTMLDVGGGEGYFAFLCRELLGLDVVVTELATSACERASELFGLPAVCADAEQLPFANGSFDLVVCSEVMEHVEAPQMVASELRRVAHGHVMVTTEQYCHTEREQKMRLRLRDPADQHPDRNFFIKEDLRRLFGEPEYEASEYLEFIPWDESRLMGDLLYGLIAEHSEVDKLHPRGAGIIFLLNKSGIFGRPTLDEKRALDIMIAPLVLSPNDNPRRHSLRWPAGIWKPVCRVPHPEQPVKCNHIQWPRPALAIYTPPPHPPEPLPEWAQKFHMSNTAYGSERRQLSKALRSIERWRILTAPEHIAPKATWLIKRAFTWKKKKGAKLPPKYRSFRMSR